MRICSLVPAATEILFALGLGDSVLGVTHECDYPEEARSKRVLVRPRVTATEAGAIHREVREIAGRGESLYVVDEQALAELAPDLIVTQDLCHVCAASPTDLTGAMTKLPSAPRVLSLSAHSLRDVWRNVEQVGEAADVTEDARLLAKALAAQVERIAAAIASRTGEGARPRRTVCLEWLDPLFVAGHWVPEMIAMAGGEDMLGRAGEPSRPVTWDEVLAARPEVILIAPCGYSLRAATEEFSRLPLPAGWSALPAVRESQVFAIDANGYTTRPGPRLADGVQWMACAFTNGAISLPAPPIALAKVAQVRKQGAP